VAPSEAAWDRFDQLFKSKLNVSSADLRIAALALEINATVVTANVRDFSRVPGLAWVDWSQ
jgi:tRNA(fMet)-specific endonuclease VapC